MNVNALVCRMARKRFEEQKKRSRDAWLLTEGIKARSERLKTEGNTLGSSLAVKL